MNLKRLLVYLVLFFNGLALQGTDKPAINKTDENLRNYLGLKASHPPAVLAIKDAALVLSTIAGSYALTRYLSTVTKNQQVVVKEVEQKEVEGFLAALPACCGEARKREKSLAGSLMCPTCFEEYKQESLHPPLRKENVTIDAEGGQATTDDGGEFADIPKYERYEDVPQQEGLFAVRKEPEEGISSKYLVYEHVQPKPNWCCWLCRNADPDKFGKTTAHHDEAFNGQKCLICDDPVKASKRTIEVEVSREKTYQRPAFSPADLTIYQAIVPLITAVLSVAAPMLSGPKNREKIEAFLERWAEIKDSIHPDLHTLFDVLHAEYAMNKSCSLSPTQTKNLITALESYSAPDSTIIRTGFINTMLAPVSTSVLLISMLPVVVPFIQKIVSNLHDTKEKLLDQKPEAASFEELYGVAPQVMIPVGITTFALSYQIRTMSAERNIADLVTNWNEYQIFTPKQYHPFITKLQAQYRSVGHTKLDNLRPAQQKVLIRAKSLADAYKAANIEVNERC